MFISYCSISTYIYPCSVTYDFDLEEFDIISENAQDFISQLLRLSPRNRLTAEQCLDHPWLLEQDIGQSVIKTANLRTFLARRRWQRCGQAIRAMRRMTGETQAVWEAHQVIFPYFRLDKEGWQRCGQAIRAMRRMKGETQTVC